MECFSLLFDHLAWIEHQFLGGIRDSRKAQSLWGMMRRVGGVRKSIHQSSLAKGLGLGLLYWGFKGVQEEISSEEASTLQIGSVAFPLGQCTSPQNEECKKTKIEQRNINYSFLYSISFRSLQYICILTKMPVSWIKKKKFIIYNDGEITFIHAT